MNGAETPCALANLTVVRALIAVPPMPAPNTPTARPRRCGGNQALTNGTPTAKAVPATPRKKPPTSSAARLEWPANPTNSTGTIVTNDTIGNITRPPNRSVSAPTGMRPSEPTTTGTATINACENADRCSESLNRGPSGESSAHAQKFTPNPSVANASISSGRRPNGACAAPRAGEWVTVAMITSHTERDLYRVFPRPCPGDHGLWSTLYRAKGHTLLTPTDSSLGRRALLRSTHRTARLGTRLRGRRT